MTLPGIYELQGDVLKLCFPFPFEGKFDQLGKRPTEFGSKPGGNDVLEVYKRLKKQRTSVDLRANAVRSVRTSTVTAEE